MGEIRSTGQVRSKVQSGLNADPKGEVNEAAGGEVGTGWGTGVGEEIGADVVAALSA